MFGQYTMTNLPKKIIIQKKIIFLFIFFIYFIGYIVKKKYHSFTHSPIKNVYPSLLFPISLLSLSLTHSLIHPLTHFNTQDAKQYFQFSSNPDQSQSILNPSQHLFNPSPGNPFQRRQNKPLFRFLSI